MQRKDPIQFHYLAKLSSLANRKQLKRFIRKILHTEGKKINHINYIFCSDKYLHRLNNKYLNHNSFTDIISFELSSPNEPALSDIYISIDRVRENALQFKTPFYKELHRVVFHGALHLCGFKDKTLNQAQEMRRKENFYLAKYFRST